MQKEYYPTLFIRKKKEERGTLESQNKEEPLNVKLTSIYDSNLTPLKPIKHNFITIFGTTDIDSLTETVNSFGTVKELEYGRNYLNVIYENEESAIKLLNLNRSFVNGNLVGVFKQNNVVKKNEEVFVPKRGILFRIICYLFG